MPKGEEVEVKKGEEEEEKKKSRELTAKRENPFSLFQTMDRFLSDINREFNELFWRPRLSTFGGSSKELTERPFFRTPLTNVNENEKEYMITTEVPGLGKKNLEITVHDGLLEIKGEEEEAKEEKEGEIVRREYHSSRYYRAFNLPENVDEDAIEASLDKGILRITLPKTKIEEAEKKRIEVK